MVQVISSKKDSELTADAELTEFELKIKSIKGKQTFEGLTGGIDANWRYLHDVTKWPS